MKLNPNPYINGKKSKAATKKAFKKMLFDKKIKEYKNILKEDEDWDWHYILRLLSYKLERTRRCILKNNIIKDAKKIGQEIREVEILLNNIMADKYFDQISKDFYKKYGRHKFIIKKKDSKTGLSQISTIFSKETPKTREIIHEQYFFLNQIAFQMKEDDLDKAFKLMAKNIQNWWD